MVVNEASFDDDEKGIPMIEAIPMSVYKSGMTMVPPVYSLNTTFTNLVEAVKYVQSLNIPMPTDHQGLLSQLSHECEIDTLTIQAMEAMASITEMLRSYGKNNGR